MESLDDMTLYSRDFLHPIWLKALCDYLDCEWSACLREFAELILCSWLLSVNFQFWLPFIACLLVDYLSLCDVDFTKLFDNTLKITLIIAFHKMKYKFI